MRPSILLLTVKVNKETFGLVVIRPTLKLKFLHDTVRFMLKPSYRGLVSPYYAEIIPPCCIAITAAMVREPLNHPVSTPHPL